VAKRKTQWIDTVNSTANSLVGAAAPGTIVNEVILSENELENVPNSTLIRVVGNLIFARSAGTPVITAALWLAPNYSGVALPTDWDNDTFQRGSVLWTTMFMDTVGSTTVNHHLDIRSKRRMTQGMDLNLSIQNHSLAGNTVLFSFHLRCLLLLT